MEQNQSKSSFLAKAIEKERERKQQEVQQKMNPNWEYWYTKSYSQKKTSNERFWLKWQQSIVMTMDALFVL